jgi:hypothetical protein
MYPHYNHVGSICDGYDDNDDVEGKLTTITIKTKTTGTTTMKIIMIKMTTKNEIFERRAVSRREQ